MPLDELLKLYGQNASAVNKISHEDDEVRGDLIKSFFLICNFQSNTSDDEPNPRPKFHHLLQVNGQLLPEDDDDDTDDSFEPEIVKVC